MAPLPNQRVRWLARGGMLVLAMAVGLVGFCAYGIGLERADHVLAVFGALLLSVSVGGGLVIVVAGM